MDLGGIGSSKSSTSQESLVVDNRITADGNGVIWTPRNSGNNTLRLGAGATYTINNGIGAEALTAFQSRIDALGRDLGKNDGLSDQAVADKIRGALAERTEKQIEDAPVESGFGLTNWILLGAGVVLLIGAALWKRKRK